jgi:hypothetical protein
MRSSLSPAQSPIGAVTAAGRVAEPSYGLAATSRHHAVCAGHRRHRRLAEFGAASRGPKVHPPVGNEVTVTSFTNSFNVAGSPWRAVKSYRVATNNQVVNLLLVQQRAEFVGSPSRKPSRLIFDNVANSHRSRSTSSSRPRATARPMRQCSSQAPGIRARDAAIAGAH